MSDITLGAIIAGLSGLLGALIGGAIASVNNWIQIKHQREDALISRRIKARESYLVPLREALSNYINNNIRGITAYAVLKEMERKKVEPEVRITAFKTMTASMDTGTQIMEQIENFAGQSPDAELRKMILDFKNQQVELEIIVKRNSKWLANITEINPEEWNAMLKEYNSIISTQRDRFIPINKRIEELLSGVA
jgi:Ni,Fe-hydrogenase I large subunit